MPSTPRSSDPLTRRGAADTRHRFQALERREAADDQEKQAKPQPRAESGASRLRLGGEAVEDQRCDERERGRGRVDEETGESVQSYGGDQRTDEAEDEPAQAADDGDDRNAQSERSKFPSGLGLRRWRRRC